MNSLFRHILKKKYSNGYRYKKISNKYQKSNNNQKFKNNDIQKNCSPMENAFCVVMYGAVAVLIGIPMSIGYMRMQEYKAYQDEFDRRTEQIIHENQHRDNIKHDCKYDK
jgi:ethanolamine utilization protein EutQ (cupin superfamily)